MKATEIRIKTEWMGYTKGMVLRLPHLVAKQLIERGAAEEITVSKLQRRDHDKMVKESVNK